MRDLVKLHGVLKDAIRQPVPLDSNGEPHTDTTLMRVAQVSARCLSALRSRRMGR